MHRGLLKAWGGSWSGEESDNGGKKGDICNMFNDKDKFKKIQENTHKNYHYKNN